MGTGSYVIGNSLPAARKILSDVVHFFDKENIPYYLEGGTLLGLVRDGELLPWDDDVDFSISEHDADRFAKNKWKLLLKGYRVASRRVRCDVGALQYGQYRIFKVKKLLPFILKIFYPAAKKHMIVADVFVKASDDHYTYWQAKGKIMRTSSRYYSDYQTISYCGLSLKVPFDYAGYLQEKYGNWEIPVKEWDCSTDEKTIFSDVLKE